MSVQTKFDVRQLTQSDLEVVQDLVWEHFGEEVYFKKYGWKGEWVAQFCKTRVKIYLKQNWSFGLFDKSTNKLVAVTLNTIAEESLESQHEELEREGFIAHPKLIEVQRAWATLEEGIFQKLQAKKLFYCGMAVVHKDYRKQGLLTAMTIKSDQLANQAGCDYVICYLSVDLLVDAFLKSEKHGYRLLKEIRYRDYVDPVTRSNPFPDVHPRYERMLVVYRDTKHASDVNSNLKEYQETQ